MEFYVFFKLKNIFKHNNMKLRPPLERGKISDDGEYTGSFIESIDDLELIDDPSEKLWFSPLLDVMKKHESVLAYVGLPYLPPEEQLEYCIGSIEVLQDGIVRWGGGGKFRNKLGMLFSGAYKWANIDDKNFQSKIPKELLQVINADDISIGDDKVVGTSIVQRERYEVLSQLPKKLRKPSRWWVIRYGELDIDFANDCIDALNEYLYEVDTEYTPPEEIDEWIERVSEIRREKEMGGV